MEKKQSKVVGTTKLQISEEGVSHLVGSIIEKGISDKPQSKSFSPTPAPKPTVLPFPVARHRSHGPHWGPVGSNRGSNYVNEDNEDDEDNDISDAFPMAAFANPVHRKSKKDLDLSRWRELITSESGGKIEERGSSFGNIKRKSKDGKETKIDNGRNISCGPSSADKDVVVPVEMDVWTDLNSRVPLDKPKNVVTSSSGFELLDSAADMELDNVNQLNHPENLKEESTGVMPSNSQLGVELMSHDDFGAHFEKKDHALQGVVLKKRDKKSSSSTKDFSSRSNNIGNEREPMSLESEIDTENRAWLQSMSPDEIAQAQAEIMEKMDPALLNLLKRRGNDKLKKQKCSSSVLATNSEAVAIVEENQSIQDAKGSLRFEGDLSHSQRRQDNGLIQNTGQAVGTLWKAWTGRVEAVRELRFSLDGSVISYDFDPKSESGDNSAQNKLSADNVSERDYLRTEGDPGAAGYTINEAVALTRSAVPGQRAFALHLLASVLDKALYNICENQARYALRYDNKVEGTIDWEAVWAYALGPEPELALSLRMSLDDNHNNVVLACLKVIQCTLSCDVNEYFFDISEKISIIGKDIFTAPVFRSKPDINLGFLGGGYWKYSAKPSNILVFGEEIMDDENEGKHTIQDDIAVAGQDFAAGLVRMGILPRLCFILETGPTVAMEECIISILIAITRHSPTCANAIMNCERLVQTVVHRFTLNNIAEVQPSKIKSVCLLKVLARSNKKNCTEFVKNGIFQSTTWHLYRSVSSVYEWVKLGKENCKSLSGLMVEQLRFWKVCIQNGYGVSYFPDIFPALCLWLNPPSFEKLIESNVLSEFTSISMEVYLVLEALAARLPKFYSQEQSDCGDGDMETWSWSHVSPLIDTAVKWLVVKRDLCISKFFEGQKLITSEFDLRDSSASPLVWVYSAIMLFLNRVLERVSPEDSINLQGSGKHLPWLPEFVPKIGLEIVKNGFFGFLDAYGTGYGTHFAQGISFVEELCHLRRQVEYETSLASVSCLHGLVQLVVSIDNLIQLAKPGVRNPTFQGYNLSRDENILEDGILTGSQVELNCVLRIFMELVASEWKFVQCIEIFGRGGPAPGVGHGWGASGGGFWSSTVLLAQMDARFLIHLLGFFQMVSVSDLPTDEEMTFAVQIINSTLGLCLTAGPRDKIIVEKALEILFQVPVLKFLDLCIRRFQANKRMKLFGWEYKEEDYMLFSKILVSHFKNRWLGSKRKSKAIVENSSSGSKTFKKGSVALDTIPEDLDPSNIMSQDHCCTSLAVEWARQSLPLPMHWFLSPIATISSGEHAGLQSASMVLNVVQEPDVLEIAKFGLFFLLGIEAMATFLSTKVPSPVQSVALFWKLHSLSVILLAGMGVLEDEKSRDVFEALQEHYGRLLDEAWASKFSELIPDVNMNLLQTRENCNVELLRFQSEIHESYSTYVETLVEQFAAVSYGDLLYGRQVGVYLHRCVEAPVRLAAWNSLSSARVLELLPPLENCYAKAEGYLEPEEDNEEILEAYVKSWTSGALDRAATRKSMAFTLVLHHLSSFIFLLHASGKLLLQNKLVKSLLRDYSRQRQHERMMFNLIRHNKPSQMHDQEGDSSLDQSNIDKRFEILTEACEGNFKLKSSVKSSSL
ncbi:transcriptional elongation regulator MINIYO [Pistacia vera]|uniref:transcriptional elongation regulator MINIYO n=1 Tax=Pistacia vera TaxID=55513 RepID=UPI001262E4B6|nr:transcriptional elongation regulator MINIYO [Pistacia vera]